MKKKKICLLGVLFCCSLYGMAQQMTENDHIRRGNRLYADSLFEKSEIEYRKALEMDPNSVDAIYNLGNALFNQIAQSQEKGKEAMQQYTTAAKMEIDKVKLAQIYHNIGVLNYMAQQYSQSAEAYKESLRNNPYDHETRYNLAKAMHMLKNQENQQQQQEQNQQQQEQNQQQQQEQNQQQQEQQQDQEQQQQDAQQQQQQQNKEGISKENAEQMLQAVMQDEKEIQEKQKKMMQQRHGKTLDKDW